jgi:hypothetical protein
MRMSGATLGSATSDPATARPTGRPEAVAIEPGLAADRDVGGGPAAQHHGVVGRDGVVGAVALERDDVGVEHRHVVQGRIGAGVEVGPILGPAVGRRPGPPVHGLLGALAVHLRLGQDLVPGREAGRVEALTRLTHLRRAHPVARPGQVLVQDPAAGRRLGQRHGDGGAAEDDEHTGREGEATHVGTRHRDPARVARPGRPGQASGRSWAAQVGLV